MIQLKVRTEYSFGQTFAPISRIVERLKAIGCTAAGIVDSNSTWGHIPWFKACKASGIQPVLGVEIVVSNDETTHKMWFLAKNKDGLAELYRLTSKSHQQTIATKAGAVPRVYRHDVLGMSENILKFAGDVVDAEFLLETGAYLDLSPASRILNFKKKALAEKHGLKLVDVSDNAFAFPEDKEVFELAARAGLKQTPQFILDSLDHQDVAQAIANGCAGLELPVAPMVCVEGSLEQTCRNGIMFRKMEARWTQEYEDRLNYELELIRSKDFESYFIIVADMVHYAKKHMLVGPSRGSAAGSLVCYLARITEIDPIPPKLYFERFIDVSRTDLPDIDLDFPDNKRQMVFDYMAEKYGFNNVAHIGTVSQFKPKSALIQVCKALNIPSTATAAVKVAMIERSSADSRANNCLQDTMETTKPGQEFIAAYPQAKAASLIEGHASHTGVHAAGLLVCNDEITNYATVDANGNRSAVTLTV
jgi:DNA polymerase III alpha subunit